MEIARVVFLIGISAALFAGVPAVGAPADDVRACSNAPSDIAIAACSRAIASGRHKGRELAALYYNRGTEYGKKGELDRAIADFSEAIRLDPKYANAYFHRGITHLYNSGGVAKALADLHQASELEPKDGHDAIWVDIAGYRNKVKSQLAEAMKRIDMTEWPGPVIRLLLGQSSLAVVLAAADHSDPKKKNEQVCEAHFYGGEWSLRQSNRQEALRLFRLAAKDCPLAFLERFAANAELKALGEKP